MEKFHEYRDNAARKLSIADHMLTQTYPLVHDPKLLLTVIENLFLAGSYSISSVLQFERLYKRIPAYQENFESRIEMYKMRVRRRYKIDDNSIMAVIELREMIRKHRKSPIEFRRKDSFVICASDYNMETISLSKIKEYMSKIRRLISENMAILDKNKEMFINKSLLT